MKAALLFCVSGLVAGCGDRATTVVPASAAEDNFFVRWEIRSTAYGSVDCMYAGATDVDLDLVNADTGQRFVYTFGCTDARATSGPVDTGHFDVLVNLLDARGGVIAQVNVGAENLSTTGTIDLGDVVFRIP